MDFFVRKESDSELLIGIKIYVFRKKYGDMYIVGLCLYDYCIE